MTQQFNQYGQPVGAPLPDWQPAALPARQALQGGSCRLEPLATGLHGDALYAAFATAEDDRDWTYLTEERPQTLADFHLWLARRAADKTFVTFTVICQQRNLPVGLVSYLRIDAANGSLEIGGVTWSPLMQRSVIGTEALWLLLDYAFRLGYRRCEWKCDALNAPSRNAALRLGFTYEGTFRQMMTRKGRSRDSQWYAIIDGEWPAIGQAITRWLAPDNFDDEGRQRQPLAALLRAAQAVDGGADRAALQHDQSEMNPG